MNETIMNEEMMETVVEETVKGDVLGTVLKAGGAAVLVGGVGFIAYKKVVKPLVKKIKSKKSECTIEPVEMGFEEENVEVEETK